MAKCSCFPTLTGKRKKSKEPTKAVVTKKAVNGDLRVKPEEFIDSYVKGLKGGSLEGLAEIKNPASTIKAVDEGKDEYLVRLKIMVDSAYEGGDEHEDMLSMTRDSSGCDLQALGTEKGDANTHDSNQGLNSGGLENKLEKVELVISPEINIDSGHVSDPGMRQTTEFLGSLKLKRSCSNIETERGNKSPVKSHFFEDPQNASGNYSEIANDILGSPLSVVTSCSADKVMLNKGSSSHVLPSRSRKLWWRLFLWSHKNLRNPWSSELRRISSINDSYNQKGGYYSDTLEIGNGVDTKNKRAVEEPETKKTGVWPDYQRVAFSSESSPLDRVNAWVHSLDDSQICPINGSENDDGEESVTPFTCINSSEIGECSGRNHTNRHTAEEIVQANNLIRSLNTCSSVAHIANIGLKMVPAIAAFTNLRAVNLSGNFIVHISPGSLPKSLHTLDLSRNKISTIEGLRELTRLRVLNVSYNRISRIGYGLSKCTLIKELYLAGNKISDVEGLHKLLKVTVVDLSFNKISTAKALNQLVANYNSLLTINLLGNPIQTNIGDDQLRKAVSGLLPKLVYLNRQPIKPQRAREVATGSVSKAALSNSGWNSRRKSTRSIGQSSSPSMRGRTGEGNSHRGGSISDRQRSKSRHSARR